MIWECLGHAHTCEQGVYSLVEVAKGPTRLGTVSVGPRRHRKRQLEERTEHGALWQDHDLVFLSTVGTPQWGATSAAPSRRHSGAPEIRFHDLRHTCATLLLKQSVNPKYVQELLGHADISLTLNV
jgi:integrase